MHKQSCLIFTILLLYIKLVVRQEIKQIQRNMSFGAYLKQHREANNWTIKELADRLGYSSSYVSQIESEARVPSQKLLPALAKAYRLPEEEVKRHWAEGKIHKVSLEANYKVNIKDVGEKRIHEAASKLEQSLEELKRSLTDDHFKMPVLDRIPTDDLDRYLAEAQQFCLLPKREVAEGHRVFGFRANGVSLPDAGILIGDFIILDVDAKPKNGDIVVVNTPDGLVMVYYHERGDYLELRPETAGFKKTYHLTESKMIGRLVYHIKKY